jgi:hypothetical protein
MIVISEIQWRNGNLKYLVHLSNLLEYVNDNVSQEKYDTKRHKIQLDL